MAKQPDRHDKFQNNIRWKYLELENILREYSFDSNDEITQPIAAWMMKAYELVDSMLELSKTNSEIGMIVLCRSVMEYCLWAKFISLNPKKNIQRWKLSEIRAEIATLERKDGEVDDLTELKKEQKRLKDLGYTGVRPTQLFEEVNEPELIRPYDWLSKYSHGKLAVVFDEVFKKRGKDSQYSLVMFAELEDIDKQVLWEGAALFLKFGIEALRSREIVEDINTSSDNFLTNKITVRNLDAFLKWKYPKNRVEAEEARSIQLLAKWARVAELVTLAELNVAIASSEGFLKFCAEQDGSGFTATLPSSVISSRALCHHSELLRNSGIVSKKYLALAQQYFDQQS